MKKKLQQEKNVRDMQFKENKLKREEEQKLDRQAEDERRLKIEREAKLEQQRELIKQKELREVMKKQKQENDNLKEITKR